MKQQYQQRTAAAELSLLRNADTKIISSVYCIRKVVTGYDKLVFLILSHTLMEINSTSKKLVMANVSNEKSMKATSKSFLLPYRIWLDIQNGHLKAITCKELELLPHPQLSQPFWKCSLFAPCKYRHKTPWQPSNLNKTLRTTLLVTKLPIFESKQTLEDKLW